MSKKNQYAIISGDGDQRTVEFVVMTEIGAKRRVTRERCGEGNRQA